MAKFDFFLQLLLICGIVSTGYCMTKFDYQCLAAHNSLRARHGAAKLRWSENARNRAQVTANKISAEGRFNHAVNKDLQQNILMASSSYAKGITAQAATKEWYSEIRFYNFKKGGFQHNARHFTRVVWNSSLDLGCAKAVSGNTVVIVADYDPKGNVKGKFHENVFPVKSSVRYMEEALGDKYGDDDVETEVTEVHRDTSSCRGAIDKNGMCREGLLNVDEDLTAPVRTVIKSTKVEQQQQKITHPAEQHKEEHEEEKQTNTHVPGVELENFFAEADRLHEDDLAPIESLLTNKFSS